MHKSAQLSELPSIPKTWNLEVNSSSGSFKTSRRQSTPIVYTRLLENDSGAKENQLDQKTVTRHRPFLNHQKFSLSDCDIISARELQHGSSSRNLHSHSTTRLKTESTGGEQFVLISKSLLMHVLNRDIGVLIISF